MGKIFLILLVGFRELYVMMRNLQKGVASGKRWKQWSYTELFSEDEQWDEGKRKSANKSIVCAFAEVRRKVKIIKFKSIVKLEKSLSYTGKRE